MIQSAKQVKNKTSQKLQIESVFSQFKQNIQMNKTISKFSQNSPYKFQSRLMQSENGEKKRNLNYEYQIVQKETPQDRRKCRRNLNKKKKKQRIQTLNQGTYQLKTIIEKIYYNQQTFQLLQHQIFNALSKIKSQTDFVDRLNQMIRDYVQQSSNYMERQIKKICYFQEDLNESEMDSKKRMEQDIQQICFYVRFIKTLYKQYELIKNASQQIQKIIESYYWINQPDSKQSPRNKNPLYQSTFNYLLKYDQNSNLKGWLESADNFFRINKIYDCQQILMKLNEMIQIVLLFECQDSQEQNNFDCQTDSSEKKVKKKKNNTIKNQIQKFKGQIVCNCSDEQIHFQKLLKNMQCLTLDQNRIFIKFDESWLLKIQNQYKSSEN